MKIADLLFQCVELRACRLRRRDLRRSLLPAGAGWELIEATDINDAGQIVGYGRFQGRIRAFLLTPAA